MTRPNSFADLFPDRPVSNSLLNGLDAAQIRELVANAMTMQRDVFRQLFDPRRNVDAEAGYPQSELGFGGAGSINVELYRSLYEREAIACRVVEVMPKECWQVTPKVYEDEDPENVTAFEAAWDNLGRQLRGERSWYQDEEGSPVWAYLKRADILSGIGHFGIILLGIDDGLSLDQPAEGVVSLTPQTRNAAGQLKADERSLRQDTVWADHHATYNHDPRTGLPAANTQPIAEDAREHRHPTVNDRPIGTEQAWLTPNLIANTHGQPDFPPHLPLGRDANGRLFCLNTPPRPTHVPYGTNGNRHRHDPVHVLNGDLALDGTAGPSAVAEMLRNANPKGCNQHKACDESSFSEEYSGLKEAKGGAARRAASRIDSSAQAQAKAATGETKVIQLPEGHEWAGRHAVVDSTGKVVGKIWRQKVDADKEHKKMTRNEEVEFPSDLTANRPINPSSQARTSAGTSPWAEVTSPFGSVGLGAQGTDAQYMGVQLGPPEYPSYEPCKQEHKLLYLRVFDESLVQVVQYESNARNPRFGLPVMYRVMLNDPREMHSGIGLPLATIRVHWSRVIHVADNRSTSEAFGVPRMRPVLNRLLDLRKIYAAGAEGYWKSAFTGIALSTIPQLGADVSIDVAGTQRQIENYQDSLQRWLILNGMQASTLAPTVTDPTSQVAVNIEAVCIQIECPVRVFKGSERGELASSQDDSKWNDRVHGRCVFHITPNMIIPLADRLISMGVLPEPTVVKERGLKAYKSKAPAASAVAVDKQEQDAKDGEAKQQAGLKQAQEHQVKLAKAMPPPANGKAPKAAPTGNRHAFPASQPTHAPSSSQRRLQGMQPRFSIHERVRYVRVARRDRWGYLITNAATGEPETTVKEVRSTVVTTEAGYSIEWPARDSLGKAEKATIALTKTQALVAYVGGGVEALMPPPQFFTHVMDMSDEEANAILAAAMDNQEDGNMTIPAAGEEGHPATPPPKTPTPIMAAPMPAARGTPKPPGTLSTAAKPPKPAGIGGAK